MRLVYIAIGGALGALARWKLSAAIAPTASFPLGILVVNLSGCLLLGFLFPYTLARELAPDLRLGIVTGFIGAYTTFSTWEDGTLTLFRHGALGVGAAYLAASFMGGLVCTVAGMAVARRILASRTGRPRAGD